MNLGDFEIHFLTDGTFKLDGGTMFGIVPRALWAKERQPDERHRILLACNCPLIRTSRHNILIDCGLGRKWNEKQRAIYAIEPRPRLLEELAAIGLAPKDITHVIHTHLHFDHAGWNTQLNARGEPEAVFANARHVVERRELEVAHKPNELQRGTYLPDNFTPLDAQAGWEVFEGEYQLAPGILAFRTGGHTAGHVAVRIESQGQAALCLGDLLPTTAHCPLPWLMSYDLFPLETLEAKRALFKECLARDALVFLDHDPTAFAVRLRNSSGDKIEAIKEW